VIRQLGSGHRSVLSHFLENRGQHARRNAPFAFAMPPPRRLGDMSLLAVSGERARRKDAALLREVLERVPGKEVSPHVAALYVFGSRHDHEVRIRSDGVERIELDAAEPVENRARAASAASDDPIESEVRDQAPPRLRARERDRH
jgi:hypothetical protein